MHHIHTGQIVALTRQLATRQLLGAREHPGKGAGRGGNKGCGVTAQKLWVR